MKLTKIEMGMNYIGYGEGAEPGIQCTVELRAPGSFSSITLKLPPEHVKQVCALAVSLAAEQLVFDPETIDVMGKPGRAREKAAKAEDACEEMAPL